MSIHNARADLDLEAHLRQFGYASLFAHRETMDGAMKYINLVAQGSENPAAVMTAVFVYANTLLRVLHESGHLTKTSDGE